MANEQGFRSQQVTIFKETTPGKTPNPIAKGFSFGVINMSFNRNQRTETNAELGNGGEGSRTDTGGEDPAGDMEVKYKSGLFPILAHAILGEADTKADPTVGVWTTATAYAVDDVTAHSGGKKLIVQSVEGTGTSGATEPDLTGLVDGDTVIDNAGANQIVWVVRDAIFDYTGTNKQDVPSMGMYIKDHTDQGGGVDFERTLRGFYFNSLTVGKESGNIIYKYSIPAIGMGIDVSTEAGYTTPTITSTVEIPDNPYKREEMCLTIGGVAPKNASSFILTIERGTTMEDAVECGFKIATTPQITVSGNMVVRFSKEEYTKAYNNQEEGIIIEYRKANGDFTKFTIPLTQKLDSPLNYSTEKPIELDIPLNAYGTKTTSTVSYYIRAATDL